MLVQASITNPPPDSNAWSVRMEGPDRGVINAWLRGIEKSKESPALVTAAKAGELPLMAWKGGVEKAIARKDKVGSLHYLAAWQALRGEDLNVDTDSEVSMTCTRTGVPVLFTLDIGKLLPATDPDAPELFE